MSLELVEAATSGKFKAFSKEFNRLMGEQTMEAIERTKAEILGNSLVEGEEVNESDDDFGDNIKINVASVTELDEAISALERLGVDAELVESENVLYVEKTEDNQELCEAWAKRFDAVLLA